MPVDAARRVKNLFAWLLGALLCQAAILGAGSLYRPDPAYGAGGSFFFGEMFGLGGVLIGLIGYAVAAAFLKSSASPFQSLTTGVIFGAVMVGVTFLTDDYLPESMRLWVFLGIWFSLGSGSFVACQMRSNNRWKGP